MVAGLHNLSLENLNLEEKIQEKAEILCDDIKSYGGKPFSCYEHLRQTVNNIIVCLCFGERFVLDTIYFYFKHSSYFVNIC